MKNKILKTLCLMFFISIQICFAQKVQQPKTVKNKTIAEPKTNSSDSQFYIGFNAGYNFPAGANTNGNYRSENTSATTSKARTFYVSYGKGTNFGLNMGYNLNKHFGFELGVNYLIGEINDESKEYDGKYFNTILNTKMLQFKPTVFIAAGYEKINPYAKFGLVLSTGNITEKYDSYDLTDKSIYAVKFFGGIGIGFTSSAGISYKINDKLNLFGELNYIKLTYSPKNSTVIESSKNGIDLLPSYKTSEIETEYVESITTVVGAPAANVNEFKKEIAVFKGMSSIGLNIGLQYNF